MSQGERIRIGRISNAEDFSHFLAQANLESNLFLVKPNWSSPHYGNYTETQVLELLLSNLPGKKIVVESYAGARNDGSREITPENAKRNWDWIREQDRWFLETTGIDEVLRKYNAEYVNITEEVWQGRAADPEAVASIVQRRYPGVIKLAELYSYVPQRLFELKGSTFINLAKLKSLSFSLKNLFGLIPDPWRYRWHGPRGSLLGQSIVEISAIYRALFDMLGILEGIYRVPFYRDSGRFETPWGNYDVVENLGVVLMGRELVVLDDVAATMIGTPIRHRSFMRLGRQLFGEWDEEASRNVPVDLVEAFKSTG